MERLKVEYTAFDYREHPPSKSFFKQLSHQITPRVLDVITDREIKASAVKACCLSIDVNSYLSPHFINGTNSMQINIAGYSAPLIICTIEVLWWDDNGNRVFPWDVIEEKLRFDIRISEADRRNLNQILPQIYHPVIMPEKSGLPFAYQVFYGGDTLTFHFTEKVRSDTISEVCSIVDEFIVNWNAISIRKIHGSMFLGHSDTRIKLQVDFGEADHAAEALIRSFITQENLKKIVLR